MTTTRPPDAAIRAALAAHPEGITLGPLRGLCADVAEFYETLDTLVAGGEVLLADGRYYPARNGLGVLRWDAP